MPVARGYMHNTPLSVSIILVTDALTKNHPRPEQVRQARQDAHRPAAAAPPAGRGRGPGAADHPVRAAQLHGLLGLAALGGHPAHHGGAGRGAGRLALRRGEACRVSRLSERRHPIRQQSEHLSCPWWVRGLRVAAVRFTTPFFLLFLFFFFLFSIFLLFSLRHLPDLTFLYGIVVCYKIIHTLRLPDA